jgi:hypothetical protein
VARRCACPRLALPRPSSPIPQLGPVDEASIASSLLGLHAPRLDLVHGGLLKHGSATRGRAGVAARLHRMRHEHGARSGEPPRRARPTERQARDHRRDRHQGRVRATSRHRPPRENSRRQRPGANGRGAREARRRGGRAADAGRRARSARRREHGGPWEICMGRRLRDEEVQRRSAS